MDLLKDGLFPENTLFCGDAGFVGYALWSSILDAGHHFLIHVGANVRLLTDLECVRGRDGIVCLWPDAAARRKQPRLDRKSSRQKRNKNKTTKHSCSHHESP